jgi:membrane protein YdbS with pleckstrin-like domain
MFRITDVIQLQPEERVCGVYRRHSITLWPRLILAGMLIVLPFFYLFPLTGAGPLGLFVFILFVAAGLVVALRAFFMWDADILLLTNRRVVDVDQKGVWSRTVSEVPLVRVEEVRWDRRGLVDSVCRLGTVRIRASGSSQEICARRLFRPQSVHAAITTLREGFVDLAPPAVDDRRRRVLRMLSDVDDRTIEAIESVLDEMRRRS